MNNSDQSDAIDAAIARRGKQASIAAELGWPESDVSEVKTFLKKKGVVFLKGINMKVVPEDMVCVKKEKLQMLLGAVQVAMPALTVDQLLEP